MVRLIVEMPDGKGCKEHAIIELQGDLETRHPVPLTGKFIGDLHFTKENVPVLIIGHHILHGKVILLDKPLGVMTKVEQAVVPTDDRMDVDGDDVLSDSSNTLQRSSVKYEVKAIVKKKLLFKTRPKPIIAHVPKKI